VVLEPLSVLLEPLSVVLEPEGQLAGLARQQASSR
jgi:hypothetical protein